MSPKYAWRLRMTNHTCSLIDRLIYFPDNSSSYGVNQITRFILNEEILVQIWMTAQYLLIY